MIGGKNVDEVYIYQRQYTESTGVAAAFTVASTIVALTFDYHGA
jgi:hypothetical protein